MSVRFKLGWDWDACLLKYNSSLFWLWMLWLRWPVLRESWSQFSPLEAVTLPADMEDGHDAMTTLNSVTPKLKVSLVLLLVQTMTWLEEDTLTTGWDAVTTSPRVTDMHLEQLIIIMQTNSCLYWHAREKRRGKTTGRKGRRDGWHVRKPSPNKEEAGGGGANICMHCQESRAAPQVEM